MPSWIRPELVFVLVVGVLLAWAMGPWLPPDRK
jgi:hypothetical protein